MSESIEQAFSRYGQSLIEGDHKATVDFIYPEIFKFIPRETIANSLQAAQASPSVKISFDHFQIISIDTTHDLHSVLYSIITTGSKIKMIYAPSKKRKDEEDDQGSSELEFSYEIFVAKYGESNVKMDKLANSIEANTTSRMLAVKENDRWYFLDLKPHWIELYDKFLPSSIVADLKKLFPEEEEEPVKDAPAKRTKLYRKKSRVVDGYQEGNIRRVYLSGWDVHLNGDQHCEDFIATQITTKEIFRRASLGLELIFENDKLINAIDYEDGEKKKERKLQDDEVGLVFQQFPLNRVYQFEESRRGKHQLGGNVPKGFILPQCNTVVPFQYLGHIDDRVEPFKWLPFKLHLTAPIYLNVMNVYLHYEDPMRPVVINVEDLEGADTSYDELNRETEIVFESARFNFVEDVEFGGNCAGIPQWIQGSDIPRCPKSGNRMKFVCQLHGGVGVKRSNVDDANGYFTEMNFWGDGDLFVFFEPASKVACYFIQNT